METVLRVLGQELRLSVLPGRLVTRTPFYARAEQSRAEQRSAARCGALRGKDVQTSSASRGILCWYQQSRRGDGGWNRFAFGSDHLELREIRVDSSRTASRSGEGKLRKLEGMGGARPGKGEEVAVVCREISPQTRKRAGKQWDDGRRQKEALPLLIGSGASNVIRCRARDLTSTQGIRLHGETEFASVQTSYTHRMLPSLLTTATRPAGQCQLCRILIMASRLETRLNPSLRRPLTRKVSPKRAKHAEPWEPPAVMQKGWLVTRIRNLSGHELRGQTIRPATLPVKNSEARPSDLLLYPCRTPRPDNPTCCSTRVELRGQTMRPSRIQPNMSLRPLKAEAQEHPQPRPREWLGRQMNRNVGTFGHLGGVEASRIPLRLDYQASGISARRGLQNPATPRLPGFGDLGGFEALQNPATPRLSVFQKAMAVPREQAAKPIGDMLSLAEGQQSARQPPCLPAPYSRQGLVGVDTPGLVPMAVLAPVCGRCWGAMSLPSRNGRCESAVGAGPGTLPRLVVSYLHGLRPARRVSSGPPLTTLHSTLAPARNTPHMSLVLKLDISATTVDCGDSSVGSRAFLVSSVIFSSVLHKSQAFSLR
ncbi:hypothetical protein JHW43_008441 [Diplocarpon mali]|nr:hypothetical protein JHW43_008441 [Diplocarpon mali]